MHKIPSSNLSGAHHPLGTIDVSQVGPVEYFGSFLNIIDVMKIALLTANVITRVMFLSQYNSIEMARLNPDEVSWNMTSTHPVQSRQCKLYNNLFFLSLLFVSSSLLSLCRVICFTDILTLNKEYPEMQLRSAASLYQTENIVISLTVLVLYFKVFKYFELSPGLSEFSRTLEGAAPHLYRFTIVVIISLSGFSLSGYFLFGTQFADYSSLGLSVVALMRGLFGDMNANSYYSVNRVFGPLFFLMYQLFAQFIFLEHFMTYVSGASRAISRHLQSHCVFGQ
jgi:hypothetical protein